MLMMKAPNRMSNPCSHYTTAPLVNKIMYHLMRGWVLIFQEVEVSQLGGDLDVDDEGSEQNIEPL
jgi:hypothetical protein